MYARYLKALNHSFFLFGSRSTGKTTWLKSCISTPIFYDLLNNKSFLKLSRDPDLLYKEVAALKSGTWVVIDEVQRIPNLLNSVHRLINDFNDKFLFALSGSSARKLRKQNSNLLAGRVAHRDFFPLVGHELKYEFKIDQLLKFGTLPQVCSKSEIAIDTLESYVVNYLQQEIQQEAITRNLDAFNRFLEVAGIMNGRVLNISSIARDVGLARTTVERYFSILVDTLIGYMLPAWNPRLKVKEIKSPKFYFFDCGVVRAITNQLREPLNTFEKGYYLETLVLNELRAWISYENIGGKLSYWSVDANNQSKEIDFIWTRGKHNIGFEIKANNKWKKEYGKALKELKAANKLSEIYGVYLGDQDLVDQNLHVLSIKSFMQKLFSGSLLY